MSNKLLVISVDAMHTDDLPFARGLPGFARILENASVAEIEGVYPSVTYPNHVAQITGCPPASSGVFNNQQFQPHRGAGAEWFWDSRAIKVPTIFAAARDAGLTTAAVQWPVTAHEQSVDWLVPEIASPWLFDGLEDQYRQTTNVASLERYILPNLHRIDTDRPKGKYLDFASHLSVEILRRERPDLMFAHLVELDFARHAKGTYGPHVEEALRAVDATLCKYLSTLEETGELDSTNIVIVSDHGHIDTVQHTSLNAVFSERGFLRTHSDGSLIDYDVFCLGAGLSAQLFVDDGITQARRADVTTLLTEIEADPKYRIEKIWTAEEARRVYGLDGPFDFVVESEPGVAVGTQWDRPPVLVRGDAHFPPGVGSHGHAPRHGGQPVFIVTGPDFHPGLMLGRRSMLDEAPTFAAVLEVKMPFAEGAAMFDVLKTVGGPDRATLRA